MVFLSSRYFLPEALSLINKCIEINIFSFEGEVTSKSHGTDIIRNKLLKKIINISLISFRKYTLISSDITNGVKNNNYSLVTTAYVMVKAINSGGIFYLIIILLNKSCIKRLDYFTLKLKTRSSPHRSMLNLWTYFASSQLGI